MHGYEVSHFHYGMLVIPFVVTLMIVSFLILVAFFFSWGLMLVFHISYLLASLINVILQLALGIEK
jgi:hypothetical protein